MKIKDKIEEINRERRKKELTPIKLEWLKSENEIVSYTPVIVNLGLILNRIRIFGDVPQKINTPFLLSVLNDNGDTIKDYNLNKEQINYLKRILKLRVEKPIEEPKHIEPVHNKHIKVINGRKYFYQSIRKGNKVTSKYIGAVKPVRIKRRYFIIETQIRHFLQLPDSPDGMTDIIIEKFIGEIPEIAYTMCKKPVRITIEEI